MGRLQSLKERLNKAQTKRQRKERRAIGASLRKLRIEEKLADRELKLADLKLREKKVRERVAAKKKKTSKLHALGSRVSKIDKDLKKRAKKTAKKRKPKKKKKDPEWLQPLFD